MRSPHAIWFICMFARIDKNAGLIPLGVGTFGSYLGAAIVYWLSLVVGRPLLLRYGRYFLLHPEKLEKAENWLERYEAGGVFFARVLPVIRHFISGIDWAIAGAAMLAAPATPIPVILIKSRRFIELPSPCDDLCQPSLRRFSAAWNIHSRISTLISHVATQKTRRPATPGLWTRLK